MFAMSSGIICLGLARWPRACDTGRRLRLFPLYERLLVADSHAGWFLVNDLDSQTRNLCEIPFVEGGDGLIVCESGRSNDQIMSGDSLPLFL